MKKLILTSLALAAGVALGYSQGTISLNNSTAGFFISTNTGTPSVSGTVGVAGTGANSYYYTVLTANYGGATPSTSDSALVSATWTWTGVTGVNATFTKGAISASGSAATASGSWPAPTGNTYSSGTIEYYVVLGWSANEGTSWATVANELQNNDLVTGGYFGVSPVAYNYSGGGPNGLNAVPVLIGSGATGLSGSGLTSGFDLYVVPTPEPSTIALGVMGAASLLALRRKKA